VACFFHLNFKNHAFLETLVHQVITVGDLQFFPQVMAPITKVADYLSKNFAQCADFSDKTKEPGNIINNDLPKSRIHRQFEAYVYFRYTTMMVYIQTTPLTN
jgi:hypothetical protein